MNAETQNREEGWSGYVLSVGRQAESEGSSPGPGSWVSVRDTWVWNSRAGGQGRVTYTASKLLIPSVIRQIILVLSSNSIRQNRLSHL